MVDIDAAASQIYSDLQSACYDFAEGSVRMETNNYQDEIDYMEVEKRADEFYNDPASVGDFIGDRIYDASKGDVKVKKLIAESLKGHDALVKACDTLINERYT
jgi:hypothetical protein